MKISSPKEQLVKAPAKLNLSLRVLGKLVDGYHHISSLIVPLALEDQLLLRVTPSSGRENYYQLKVECAGELKRYLEANHALASFLKEMESEQNLAQQAAELFVLESGLLADVSIRLIKNIPAQAGLGGGSSDAAAVLRGLDSLFPKLLGSSKLLQIAAKLGSDVPALLMAKTVFVYGKGENPQHVKLTPSQLNCLENLTVILAKPFAGSPTEQAYGLLEKEFLQEDSISSPRVALAKDLSSLFTEDFKALRVEGVQNDFDCAKILAAGESSLNFKQVLGSLADQDSARANLLCGSGSARALIIPGQEDTDALVAELRVALGASAYILKTSIARR